LQLALRIGCKSYARNNKSAAKQAGFSAHRTQFAADGPFSRLDAETQRAMFAYEHYILARPVDAGPVAADDLFA
jgi:hypothetical protein